MQAANGELIWFDIPGLTYDGTDDPTDQDYTLYTYDAWGQECRRPTTDGLYYSGEMYDQNLAMYNLRARYYNPANGRFNAIDPYAGSSYDPQSLHKYLYCHADPVNGIDPSGKKYTLVGAVSTMAITYILFSANVANAPGPEEVTIPDLGGEMVIDGYWTIAGGVVISHVILPATQMTIKWVGRKIRPIPSVPGVTTGPGKWVKVNEHMSDRAAIYQEQITGKPAGNVYLVDGVKIDGYEAGKLLEAKGLGYENFVKNGEFVDWWAKGRNELISQAQSQIRVANGCTIEWHFADEEVLNATQALLREEGINGIKYIHTPAK